MVISAEGKLGGESLFDGKASLAFADQRFEGTATFLDKSKYDDARYSTEWHVTHPGSFLDVTFKSEVGEWPSDYITTKSFVWLIHTGDELSKHIDELVHELNQCIVPCGASHSHLNCNWSPNSFRSQKNSGPIHTKFICSIWCGWA